MIFFIAWTNSISIFSNESSSSKICDSSRQMKQKMKIEINLFNFYYFDKINELIKLETDFNNDIFISNSNTNNENDKNVNSTVLNNDIDCDVVVQF